MKNRTKAQKDEDEIKRILEKRFNHIGGDEWKNLSEDERKKMIQKYYDISGFEVLDTQSLLTEARNQRINFMLVALGLGLGIIGNLVADVLHEYFSQFAPVYPILITAFFLILIYQLFKLPEVLTRDALKEGRFFQRIRDLVTKDQLIEANSLNGEENSSPTI